MRVVLVGAVEGSAIALDALIGSGCPPIAVCTLPLSKAARHSDFVDLRPRAVECGIPVVESSNINDPATLNALRCFEPDYIAVIGWSQICRDDFLRLPKKGCIGYHPALLPENRGRAVIPWTILQRASHTGSTLFWLDHGADSGDILLQRRIEVAPDETARSLYQKHMDALCEMLREALPLLASHSPPRAPQDHRRATYCSKRVAADGLIDWSLPAPDVWTLIRAVGEPYPGAFSFYRRKRVLIWDAELVGDAPYHGVTGQIQTLTADGALVRCGDGRHVLLKVVQTDGGMKLSPIDVFKNHERLGIDWISAYSQMVEGSTP